MNSTVAKNDLVFPELSYKLIGCAFDLFNEIGGGHKENIYQKGLGLSFEKQKISFTEQVHYDQVLNYLTVSDLKLALLITFTSDKVRLRRVINFKSV